MEKIRIGNDISIEWSIKRNGQPEDLSGRKLTVNVVGPYNTLIPFTYRIDGNVVYLHLLGKDQKRIGAYSLILVENMGLPGMTTVDHVDAFYLVPHTYLEGGNGCSDVKINRSVKLSSDVDQAKSGLSAYELDVAAGNFSGTLDEWLVWIKKPAIDAASKVDEAIKQMDGKEVLKNTNDIII